MRVINKEKEDVIEWLRDMERRLRKKGKKQQDEASQERMWVINEEKEGVIERLRDMERRLEEEM